MTKIEGKFLNGDRFLETFFTVTVAEDFVVHKILVQLWCIMESNNGSLNLDTQKSPSIIIFFTWNPEYSPFPPGEKNEKGSTCNAYLAT